MHLQEQQYADAESAQYHAREAAVHTTGNERLPEVDVKQSTTCDGGANGSMVAECAYEGGSTSALSSRAQYLPDLVYASSTDYAELFCYIVADEMHPWAPLVPL